MNRIEKGVGFFREGHNCAQAVLFAFDDILPIEGGTLMDISAALGGGFARTRNLCGAVSAIGMIVGLLHKPEGEDKKLLIYKKTQELANEFKERNKYLNCGELLRDIKTITSGYVPQPRTEDYYKVRPCVKFVSDAIEILEKAIDKNFE